MAKATELSNNAKYRNYIMAKIRAIIDPANIMACPDTMYPGLWRTYHAVRQFLNPILKAMGVPVDKNNMLTDKQFAIAISMAEKYTNVAVYEYLQHTNWNNGWRTNFEVVEKDGKRRLKKSERAAVYEMKESARDAAFPAYPYAS